MKEKYFTEVGANVAVILRAARENKELSLSSVAERAGLSHQMVSFVEREMRKPTLDTLLRIAVALDVDLVDVLGRAQKATRTAKPVFRS